VVSAEKIIAAADRWPVVVIILVGTAATWSIPFANYMPGDFINYVETWYEHIIAHGRIGAFAAPFGNYTPPYLYLLSAGTLFDGILPPVLIVKLLAVAGTLWMAGAVYLLLIEAGIRRPAELAAWSMLLPSVVLNTAFMGQADMFWVAPCVLAVRAALRKDPLRMVAWAGVGFAFKAQTVFLAPFVIALLIQMRARWYCWLIPPLVYMAMMLPAWLAGWPLADLLSVYLRQAAWRPEDGSSFSGNAANWWSIFAFISPTAANRSFAVGYALATVASIAYIWHVSRSAVSKAQLLPAAALSAAMIPWLLPAMHERFLILAEILAFCFAAANRGRKSIAAAALMQLAALYAVYGFLLAKPGYAMAGCFFVASAMVLWIEETASSATSVKPRGWRRGQMPRTADG
jgi:Gpi18-like mannosyltransferase